MSETAFLEQAEIDSLLGDNGSADAGGISGIQRLISSGLVSYGRLPMLEIVVDRLAPIMTTSLREFTNDNAEASVDDITSIRCGDYLKSVSLPAMLAVFKADQWDNYGLMISDAAMVYPTADVLLGGRRGTAAMRLESRVSAAIEHSLVERLICVVLQDLSASFEPLTPVDFRFERIEINPSFAAISHPANASILVRLRIDIEGRGGRLEFLLTYSTLEPVRELLLQQFTGEKFGRDSIWQAHLAEELWKTGVELSAVLGEQTMWLNDLRRPRVGDHLPINAQSSTPVQVRCGSVALFEGHLERRKDRVAVRLDTQPN